MKNKIILIILLLLITGCTKKEEIIEKKEEEKVEKEVVEYVDDNPIKIGIYENDLNLIKEYKTTKQSNKDLIFSFYYTDIEVLENRNQKANWNKYFNEYTNIDNYKIGFHFSFYVGDKKIEKTILNPEEYAFNPYFYIYIYDDINQPDYTFYSHLTEEDINENTIFSSIKLYLVEPQQITSKIEFTVFTYDSLDDFDEDNNYRGNSKYTINIELV